MGTRASIGKQPGAFTIIGDDPKKYAAAMVEYTKEKVKTQPPKTKIFQLKSLKHSLSLFSEIYFNFQNIYQVI